MDEDVSYFRRTVARQILIVLFWISGVSISLAVIVWIRLFKILFGDSLFISNAVITILLAGISIGSFYFGNKVDKEKDELHIFFIAELGVGSFSLLLLLLFQVILVISKFIVNHTQPQSLAFTLFQLIVFVIFLLPPSILVGATLSTLSRFFIDESHRVSREIGNLVGIKLLGAAVGCMLSGFFFFHVFGIKQSLVLSIAFNLLNVVLLRFLLNQAKATINIETEFYDQQLKHLATSKNANSSILKYIVIIGFGVSGVIIFSYLILWVRSLTMVMGADTYATQVMIIVFLFGFSIGAILFSRFIKDNRNLLAIFAVAEIFIGVFGILSVLFIPSLPWLNHTFGSIASNPITWGNQLFIYFIDASVIIFFPGFLVGITLPLVGRIVLANYEVRGKTIGSVISFFAIGGALGVNITRYIFIPGLGVQKSLIFLALIGFLIGLIVLFFSSLQYGRLTKTILVFGSVITLFFLSLLIPSNMIRRSYERDKEQYRMLFVNEARNTTVTVHQNKENQKLNLTANGMELAGTNLEWLASQRILGHLPLLLHPNPDTVLAFGFRSGETLKSILLYPVKQVDCTENMPEIIEASTLLNSNRFDLSSHSNLRMIHADGKNYNLLTRTKYHIIVNNLLHPAFDNNTRFYSLNHFLACRKNLKSGGIMATGVPLFKMSIEDFKILLHTFQTVFPATTLWYVNNCLSPYAILIGSADPKFHIDYGRIVEKLKDTGIITNLSRIGVDNSYEILDCFIMGPQTIAGLTQETPLNKDNAPHLEFSTPKTLDIPANWSQVFQLLASYRESVYPLLANTGANLEEEKLVKAIVENYYQSSENVLNALSLELFGKPERALSLYRQVFMTNRFDRGAKRFFDSYYDSLLVPAPETAAEFTENASVYYQKMEYEEAINLLNKAVDLKPDYAPAYFALGINHEIIGELETAKKMYQKTLNLKPDLQQVKDRLDSLSVKIKQQKSKK